MATSSAKRNLELSTPSPSARLSKKQDNKSTPKSRLQPPQASVKPLYPSNQDKHNLVNVVDHFTKLALEPDLDRIPKGAEQSEGEGLVLKIELRKIELVNGLDSLITSLLINELGKNDAYDEESGETVDVFKRVWLVGNVLCILLEIVFNFSDLLTG